MRDLGNGVLPGRDSQLNSGSSKSWLPTDLISIFNSGVMDCLEGQWGAGMGGEDGGVGIRVHLVHLLSTGQLLLLTLLPSRIMWKLGEGAGHSSFPGTPPHHALFRPSATYIKVYLLENGACLAKKKTKVAKKTCDPLYQQALLFDEGPQGKVLQVSIMRPGSGATLKDYRLSFKIYLRFILCQHFNTLYPFFVTT